MKNAHRALPAKVPPRHALPDPPSTAMTSALWAALAALLLFAAAVPLFWCGRVWLDPAHPLSYQPLVPAAAAYLAWHRRFEARAVYREVFELFGAHSTRLRGGLWLAALGAALLLLACLTKTAGNGVLGLVVASVGVVHALYGRFVVRALAAPLLLLLAMVPWPDSLAASLTFTLQIASTNMAGNVLDLVGVPNDILGTTLDIGGHRLEVSTACSGMSIVFPTLTMTLWYLLLTRARAGVGSILLLAALAASALMNVLRIVAMGLLGEQDPALAQRLHDLNSWLFTLGALGAAYGIARYLGLRHGPPRVPVGLDSAEPLPGHVTRGVPVPYRLAALLAATGVLGIVITLRFARAGDWLPPLPGRLAAWQSRESHLSPQSLAILGNPRWDARLYRNALGEEVAVCFVAAGSFDAYHDPTVCLTGYGFNLSAERHLPMDPARPEDGRRVRAMVFRQAREPRTAIVMYYWLQNRDGTTDTANRMGTYRDLWARMRTGWGAVARGQQTVIVRVLAVVPSGDPTGAQSRRNVRRIADAVAASMNAPRRP